MNTAFFFLYRVLLRITALAMMLGGLAVLALMTLEALSETGHTPEQWAMGGVLLAAMAAFTAFSRPLWRYAGRFPPQGTPTALLWTERTLLAALLVAAGIQAKAAHDFSVTFRPVLPAIALLVETRQGMSRWYQEHGHWPRPGIDMPLGEKPAVSRLDAATSGPGATDPHQELTVTLAPSLPAPYAGHTLRMITDDGHHWRCLPGTLPPVLLPPSCQ